MTELIDVQAYPVKNLLPILLLDKSCKKNIIWATDAYAEHGSEYGDKREIRPELLSGMDSFRLRPRISKSLEEQQERTRKKAEVMTPVWICNTMNNYMDEQWFGRKDVFNRELKDHSWIATADKVDFGKLKWKQYVDSRRLEITCGEAPYLVSRYDTTTGQYLSSLVDRIGILDRKLRIVNENTDNEADWKKWAERALESCYGYEYQGDSLLIARINVLLTYCEYYTERWKKVPYLKDLSHLAHIIAWNLWQMDGLKDTVPLGKPYVENYQYSLFGSEEDDGEEAVLCKIFDWRTNESLPFKSCKMR